MKEEKILRQTVGTATGFEVPEGYFDTFETQLIARIPAGETKVVHLSAYRRLSLLATSRKTRKWAAAACAAIVVGVSSWAIMQPHARHQESQSAAITATPAAIAHHHHSEQSTASSTQDTFDEVVDYVMYDNQDIYSSLMASRD